MRLVRIFTIILSGLMLGPGLMGCSTMTTSAAGGFVTRTVVVQGEPHTYQVFVPAGHSTASATPIILFLHGSGERGDDGDKQTRAGLGPYVRAHAADFPALVVFPQLAENSEWMGTSTAPALAALEAATREFNGDPQRTYLTGLSMGGYGTWEIALQVPGKFAALVPICGALLPFNNERALFVTAVADAPDPYAALAAKLGHVPVWIFHGARDDVVLPNDDRHIYAALKASGAPVRYTEFPEANHNAWDPAYQHAPLWQWLFAQRNH